MDYYALGAVERRFAEILWKNAPIPSGELVKLCKAELNWSKSTTYTVLRKLCEKGLFLNENGEVRVLVTKDEYSLSKGEGVLKESFGGSLPAFIAAFTSKNKLSPTEIDDIQRMIDAFRKEGYDG